MRISDWSSDVCSSDLLDLEHIVNNLSNVKRIFGSGTGTWLQNPYGRADSLSGIRRAEPMRILEVREKTIFTGEARASATLDFRDMTTGLIAVLPDVVRDGNRSGDTASAAAAATDRKSDV